MIKSNNSIYCISNYIYTHIQSKDNSTSSYSIYYQKKKINIRANGALIWENIISSSIIEDNTVSTKQYLNKFLSLGLIVELSDKQLIYKKTPYNIIHNVNNQYYIVNTLFSNITELSPKLALALKDNDFRNLNNDEKDFLIQNGYITTIDTTDYYNLFFTASPIYSVYIIFSYKCNMACIYCFEENNKTVKIMSNETIEYVLEYIDWLSTIKKVEIVFYGGEPLLECNKNNISMIMKNFNNNPNIYYRFITNGLNIPSYMPLLNKYKHKISKFVITIDGDEQTHNTKRIRHDKSGTYKDIISSINTLTNNNYMVTIRMNIDKNSIPNQKKAISDINKLISKKENLSIDIHIIHYRYNPSYDEPSLCDIYLLSNQLKTFKNLAINYSHPFMRFCNQLNSKNHIRPFIFEDRCAYNSNRIIDLNGNIYKCAEAMNENSLCIGTVYDKDNILETSKCIECTSLCKKCDYYLLCYGKCSLQNYIDKNNNKTTCDMSLIKNALDLIIDDTTSISKNIYP